MDIHNNLFNYVYLTSIYLKYKGWIRWGGNMEEAFKGGEELTGGGGGIYKLLIISQ